MSPPDEADRTVEPAGELARRQAVIRSAGRPLRFRRRLRELGRYFAASHHRLQTSAEFREAYPRTTEWLLDNSYLTRGALRRVEEVLTRGFLRKLPKLAERGREDRIRIQVVAEIVLEQGRFELDIDDLERFVRAYQGSSDLGIGELWALPAMLQLALLEELAAVTRRLDLRPGTGDAPAMPGDARGLADPARHVAACIESLRLASDYDWRGFVESVSRVEEILRRDPAGAYAGMDPESRDRYRRTVEEIARGGRGHEDEANVAHTTVRRSREAPPIHGGRRRHVGYHLVDEGREALERDVGSRPPFRVRRRRWILRHAGSVYFGLIGLLGVVPLVALGVIARWTGVEGMAFGLALLAGFAPAMTIGVSITNWLVSHLVPPRVLPKLRVEKRIPEELRTVVAVPVLIADHAELDELLGHLDVLRHASSIEGLSFVLLTDLADAPRREMPGDVALVDAARRGVRELNTREGIDGGPFCLLHRDRRWNAAEDCWMGWERKRGKLEELNRFLTGARDTGFTVTEGNVDRLRGARFVITLDADTMLPPEEGARLIGTLGHPLNRPVTTGDGRIVAGYSILQPRIDTVGTGRNTVFSWLGEEGDGLDLYSHAASDVYQDLFGEGLYAGKGIYDVRAFQVGLLNRVPENAILSHDMFEGLHGRVGLVTDIRVFEDYPTHVLTYLRRLHRWVRGDWQLLPWLAARVPARSGGRIPGVFGLLDRWKIYDNLRRSLLPGSLSALLLVGWLASSRAWVWLGLVVGVYALPVFLGAAGAARRFVTSSRVRHHPRMPVADLARQALSVAARAVGRWLLALLLLPHEALTTLDAILRTLFRLAVTRRHLLQWTSAAQAKRRVIGAADRTVTWAQLWQGPTTGIVAVGLAALLRPGSLPALAPLVAGWMLSPGIADLLSRPRRREVPTLSAAGRRRLRLVALRTWRFFEQLIDSEDNWLPPDNYREPPGEQLARRTSPTNIGMMLGATLAAYDLGFMDVLLLEATLDNVLDSLVRLERHRGHLLNWYSTADLLPLEPRYVSTVDSGNLAAAFIAVGGGLESADRRPPLGEVEVRGLCDSLDVFAETMGEICGGSDRCRVADVESRLATAAEDIRRVTGDPVGLSAVLAGLGERLDEIDRILIELLEAPDATIDESRLAELRDWSTKARDHVGTLHRLEERLLPWLTLLREPAAKHAPSSLSDPLGSPHPLRDLPRVVEQARAQLEEWERDGAPAETEAWRAALRAALLTAEEEARRVSRGLAASRDRMRRLIDDMDFRFLFDADRELFHIGYDVSTGVPDPHHYDLLASEARIASLLAIARGDVPARHWLRLGRPFGRVGGARVLLSWGATMFEYMLPPLFTRMPDESLLRHACRQAVRLQVRFADRKRIPWGISESGYYGLGADVDYPYRAFGVPALGLRHDLGERLVVAPYASMLALPLAPREVARNLGRLEDLGMLGPLGLYEALDYGPTRDHAGGEPRIVNAYMAHHQGMILIAVDNHLHQNVMVERFHADPRIGAVEHLLHERIPWQVPARRAWTRISAPQRLPRAPTPVGEWDVDAGDRLPEAQLLSNGRYTVLVTAAGAGGSTWGDLSLTRWRADPTLERHGSWIYLCEPETGDVWSSTRAPTDRPPDSSLTRFAPHTVEFRRHDRGIFVRTCVVVAADDDVEIRHLTVTNETDRPRRLGLASYAEIVLGAADEDRRHPAYSKLFVASEALEDRRLLLFRRRPRAADERPVHLGQALVTLEGAVGSFGWETDRAAFLGRGGDITRPAALAGGRLRLEGHQGSTLDSISSLACDVELEPYQSVEIAFVTAAGSSRGEVLERLDRYRSLHRCKQAADWAREHTAGLFDELGIAPSRAPELQRIFSALVHGDPALGGRPRALESAGPSRSGLWKFGISGDQPILLVRVGEPEETGLVERLLRYHAFFRRQGAAFDLVVLDRVSSGYAQPLRDRLRALLERSGSGGWLGRPGGVHIVGPSPLDAGDLELLEASARLVLDEGDDVSVRRPERVRTELPEFVPVPSSPLSLRSTPLLPPPPDLAMFNGYGGFSADGREYVIRLEEELRPPAPWANVIANPSFGTLVTEAGGGYTWALNAGENRLTPWRNDPVIDRPGDVVYLRDEETGEVWSVTPSPAGPAHGAAAACEVRHGAGYTTFHRRSHGLDQELTVLCAPDEPVKLLRLRLADLWERPRRITATYYVEWVLGSNPETASPHVVCAYEAEAELLLARNPFHDDYGSRVAFVGSSRPPHGLTTDRTEFLGRGGSLRRPAGLYRIGLSGRTDEPADPCAAFQVHLDITSGGDAEVSFALGQCDDREEAVRLARRYRDPVAVDAALAATKERWDDLLGALSIETPDPALDVMVNRWLPYQTVSSRLWARTGLYQSSGAFGFRDQLQDVLALTGSAPALARAHLLEAAARQFEEGDVLHWWQPGTRTGVRTRCSDDLLWLPYVVAAYVTCTADRAILDESVPFLAGEPLREDEADHYGAFATGSGGTVFEHCLRAIERGTTRGSHGLPLIGSGDWNDGFDRVGHEGRGESVWLAWFLAATLDAFAPLCEARAETARARALRKRAAALRSRVEAVAWDGRWYHRAYYDDGSPLGSVSNREGRIDAISQAWSVLAGGDPERSRTAMDALAERLMLEAPGLVLLLAPPFDRTDRDPGYIKGYPPGVRENGGQYTHAAVWAGWAFAELGDAAAAGRVLRDLNPALRAVDGASVKRYRVEPYVVAADVCGVAPHTGRGGWTWYTGSAAWLYRFATEAVLGLRREGPRLYVEPCLPPDWAGYRAELRFGAAMYRIEVQGRPGAEEAPSAVRLHVDGVDVGRGPVELVDDAGTHEIEVRIERATRADRSEGLAG